MPPASARRRRNPTESRSDIFNAAFHCFSRAGFDQVGIRQIAAEAGVMPALVNRYFGSKEDLFAAVLRHAVSLPSMFAGDHAKLGEKLAYLLVTGISGIREDSAEEQFETLTLLMHSLSSPTAEPIVRATLIEAITKPLAALLPGADGEARATLIFGYIVGFAAMDRLMDETTPDPAATAAKIRYLSAALQSCIDGQPA